MTPSCKRGPFLVLLKRGFPTMLETRATWSDVFISTRRAKTHGGWKTTPADNITWHGIINGRVVCVVSTVRLIEGGMAHFTVSSNARIGENAWNP